ncbi:sigma 54-interacting transcriptional regulator [Polyangium fumosum]|uniref:AAA family ATPase n=1 Tax=Polyangium fumosum TaxID=889272 RepID=A0A4V5PL53_9BACT|nr:sigma 54-interacting transcriptional regulator [Polyangium fumosum]TKC98025.1 AAA family ATPase [Polyangium fumosum]
MGAREATETLLMWASVGGGPAVLCDVLRLLRAKRARIGRVLYLMQAEGMPLPAKADLGDVELEQVFVPLSDPTHHTVIHEAVRARVLPRLRSLDGVLHINVSAGTPAMHAVWLVLHAGGAFPEGTRLWSAQRPKHGDSRIDPVEFPIRTYLAEIRRGAAANPSEAQYDPDCRSAARRYALETLARYARLPRAPLLLLGERGTGKTRLVETFVGHLKGRSNVVTVPCGTLDPNLAMSQLFGHVKGSFTGADKEHAGFLAQAQGGVLFLDEVQDLEARVQRQLVRVLQDPKRRFRPVGGTEEKEASAEIVCASHLSLEALRARLDTDLFDRVSLLLVEIPPLRECREDLREDWQRVWREARSSGELPQDAPWNGAMAQALGKSPLSGNLRDLQRLALILMARATGGTGGRWLEEGLAEWQALQARFEAVERKDVQGEGDLGTGTWNERVEAFKQRLARAAHNEHGSYVAAAEALAVSERALREHAKGKKE